MCRFVPYIRTAEGYTERISFAIYNSPYDVLYPYIFAERLVGWPERKVFWAAKSGPCVGVAPVSSYKLVKAQLGPVWLRQFAARTLVSPKHPQRTQHDRFARPTYQAIETPVEQ
jgi:hypothetical protein